MTEIEFNKLIEHEINWLSYYGLREDREKLNIDSDIYKDVRSIGYTKRVIPLMERCSPGLITSINIITSDSKFEDLTSVSFPKGENKFTPIETFLILFPDRKMQIIQKLIPKPISFEELYYTNKK
jgi:hypothetical protein